MNVPADRPVGIDLPGQRLRGAGLVSAMREPVATAYAQVAATVHPGGEEDAA
jgi:hypothetical protein